MIDFTLDRLKSEYIVDAHAHLGVYHNFHIPFASWEHCADTARRLNFKYIFASSTRALANDAQSGNTELIAAADATGGLLRPYLVFKPNQEPGQLDDLIRLATQHSTRTFKLHDDGNDLPYDHSGYLAFYEWADANQAIILFHTFGRMHLDPISRMAEQFPNIRMLLAHAGITDEDLYVETSKKHHNIYLELANSWAWYGLIERLASHTDTKRILFGSDMPFLSPEQQLGRIISARISDEVRRGILGKNAQALFQLDS